MLGVGVKVLEILDWTIPQGGQVPEGLKNALIYVVHKIVKPTQI